MLLRGRADKLHQKFKISKEMLDRLETEKQRLLKERLQQKERQTETRKESLKRSADAKILIGYRRLQRVKTKAWKNDTQECSTAEEAYDEPKTRAVEQHKSNVKENEGKSKRERKLVGEETMVGLFF